jgi:hypothetical protein
MTGVELNPSATTAVHTSFDMISSLNDTADNPAVMDPFHDFPGFRCARRRGRAAGSPQERRRSQIDPGFI